MDKNTQIIQLCEAFIYRGITTAREHILKVLNYYNKRDLITIIVYDTGEEKGKSFDENWVKYYDDITKIKYPADYEFEKIEDITDRFNSKLSAIKIANTIHKSGTVIYHIFININYKVI